MKKVKRAAKSKLHVFAFWLHQSLMICIMHKLRSNNSKNTHYRIIRTFRSKIKKFTSLRFKYLKHYKVTYGRCYQLISFKNFRNFWNLQRPVHLFLKMITYMRISFCYSKKTKTITAALSFLRNRNRQRAPNHKLSRKWWNLIKLEKIEKVGLRIRSKCN